MGGCNTFYWALKKRKKDIKNIVITEPYGSGKSSLLKAFREKYFAGNFKGGNREQKWKTIGRRFIAIN